MTSARHTITAAIAVVALGVAVAGCGNGDGDAASAAQGALAAPATDAPAAPGPKDDCTKQEEAEYTAAGYASLRPPSPMPAPGAMPAGSTMAKIAARGRIVVGVDQNTLQFGYRNPLTGTLEGFDIELLKAVATAIFGDDDIDQHITFKALTTDQRITAVQDGSVDVLASLFTANCERARQVGLSTIYYLAHQRFLVRDGSPVTTVEGLADKLVCATAGSTSLDHLQLQVPDAKPYPVAARTDCLVALQQGKVDAITSDDTILRSFQAQDKKTRILPATPFDEPEPYAIAVDSENQDLLRFVNGVLEQMRASTLRDLATRWIATPGFQVDPLSFPEPRYQ